MSVWPFNKKVVDNTVTMLSLQNENTLLITELEDQKNINASLHLELQEARKDVVKHSSACIDTNLKCFMEIWLEQNPQAALSDYGLSIENVDGDVTYVMKIINNGSGG